MPIGFGLYTEELRHGAHGVQTGIGLPWWDKNIFSGSKHTFGGQKYTNTK